jgi:hypothetical protein
LLIVRWMLLVLSLVFGIAQSQEPHPKATSSEKGATKDNHGTAASPLVVEVVPTEYAKKEAAENAKEREEKLQLDRNLVGFTEDLRNLTGVLAGIGLLQLIVFGLQAKRLRQTIESAERIERPFVVETYTANELMPNGHATNLYPDLAVSYIPGVQYGEINCGKTPAIITAQYVDLVVLEQLPEIPPYGNWEEFGDAILPSNGHRGPAFIPMGVGDGGTVQHFSAQDWADMKTGKKFFFFFGRIKYKSIFGKEHETRWGYRFYIKGFRSYFAAVGGKAYNERT